MVASVGLPHVGGRGQDRPPPSPSLSPLLVGRVPAPQRPSSSCTVHRSPAPPPPASLRSHGRPVPLGCTRPPQVPPRSASPWPRAGRGLLPGAAAIAPDCRGCRRSGSPRPGLPRGTPGGVAPRGGRACTAPLFGDSREPGPKCTRERGCRGHGRRRSVLSAVSLQHVHPQAGHCLSSPETARPPVPVFPPQLPNSSLLYLPAPSPPPLEYSASCWGVLAPQIAGGVAGAAVLLARHTPLQQTRARWRENSNLCTVRRTEQCVHQPHPQIWALQQIHAQVCGRLESVCFMGDTQKTTQRH